MNVTWVLEKNVFSERCFDDMVNYFEENNIPYHVITIVPFIHEIDGKVPEISGPVVCYGSIGIQKIAMKYNWKPGVWSNNSISENIVSCVLGKDYLNHDGIITTMSQVLNDVSMDEFFIKPNGDTKEFAGTIIKRDEFANWYQKMIDIGYLTNNDFSVIISSPKIVQNEFRLVVVNNEIVSFSRYGYDKYLPKKLPGNALKFAMLTTMTYQPLDVYVMDIGETPNGWKVIEYNTFNCSGLYDCNVNKIIHSINKFVEKKL